MNTKKTRKYNKKNKNYKERTKKGRPYNTIKRTKKMQRKVQESYWSFL